MGLGAGNNLTVMAPRRRGSTRYIASAVETLHDIVCAYVGRYLYSVELRRFAKRVNLLNSFRAAKLHNSDVEFVCCIVVVGP